MMDARELALELAQLGAADRDELLSELPEDRKSELLTLMEALQPLVRQSKPHMAGPLSAPGTSRPQALVHAPDVHATALHEQTSEHSQAVPHAPSHGPRMRGPAPRARWEQPQSPLTASGHASFELEWARQEARDCIPVSLRRLSEGQLRGLLAGEPQVVQARVVAAIRSSDANFLPPAVQRVVTAHLMRRCTANAVQLEQPAARNRMGWLAFWRRQA